MDYALVIDPANPKKPPAIASFPSCQLYNLGHPENIGDLYCYYNGIRKHTTSLATILKWHMTHRYTENPPKYIWMIQNTGICYILKEGYLRNCIMSMMDEDYNNGDIREGINLSNPIDLVFRNEDIMFKISQYL